MNCDRIARWYRWLEYASCGRALERRRLEYVDATSDAKRVLMLGEGDGRFSAEFMKHSRSSQVDSIELSREMMRLAARRLAPQKRITLHQADVRTFPLERGTYNLVVTHFFLDCFSTDEASRLVKQISESAAPDARWVVSEFCQPNEGFASYWAALFIRVAYFFFRLTTGLAIDKLPDYREALEANGFKRQSYRITTGGLLISELWQRT